MRRAHQETPTPRSQGLSWCFLLFDIPGVDQQQHLAAQFGCARFVWNRALAMKRAA
ncbi:helix-turn-helix domain-containing protein [Orrella marina]